VANTLSRALSSPAFFCRQRNVTRYVVIPTLTDHASPIIIPDDHQYVHRSAVEKSSPCGDWRSTRAIDFAQIDPPKPRRLDGVFLLSRLRPNLKEMDP
jgi:hypothetical protein